MAIEANAVATSGHYTRTGFESRNLAQPASTDKRCWFGQHEVAKELCSNTTKSTRSALRANLKGGNARELFFPPNVLEMLLPLLKTVVLRRVFWYRLCNA